MKDSADKGSTTEFNRTVTAATLQNLYDTGGDSEQEWADFAAKASIEGRTVPARPNVPRAVRYPARDESLG